MQLSASIHNNSHYHCFQKYNNQHKHNPSNPNWLFRWSVPICNWHDLLRRMWRRIIPDRHGKSSVHGVPCRKCLPDPQRIADSLFLWSVPICNWHDLLRRMWRRIIPDRDRKSPVHCVPCRKCLSVSHRNTGPLFLGLVPICGWHHLMCCLPLRFVPDRNRNHKVRIMPPHGIFLLKYKRIANALSRWVLSIRFPVCSCSLTDNKSLFRWSTPLLRICNWHDLLCRM